MQKSAKTVPFWNLVGQMLIYTPKLYALDTFFWLFISGLPALPGLIIRQFFNTLEIGKETSQLSLWITLFLVVGVARVVAIFMGRITKTQHRFFMSALVRHNLLLGIMHRPGAETITIGGKGISPGEVISFFRDDGTQIEDSVVVTNEILGEAIFAVISFILLFQVNSIFSLYVFLPLLIISVLVHHATEWIKPYRRASRVATQKVTGMIGEVFSNIETIKSIGKERSVMGHFTTLCNDREKIIVKDEVLTSILASSLHNLINIGIGIVLLVSTQIVQQPNSSLQAGDLALFIYYFSFIAHFLDFVGGFLTLSKHGEVSFERLGNLTNADPQTIVKPQALPLAPIFGKAPEISRSDEKSRERIPLQEIRIEHLSYRHPQTSQGIHDISFCLKRGSFTVITGRIGAGKTTLLRVILGLLPRSSGHILWNGLTIDRPDCFFVPPHSAYTPQVPTLFSTTLRSNILMSSHGTTLDIDRAIEVAILKQEVLEMPAGLETVIGTNGIRLSGGQRQRVAIARAIVQQPELFVFDDLSSALDIKTEEKLWSQLFSLQNQQWQPTFLVVSHRSSILERADQVIEISNGRISYE